MTHQTSVICPCGSGAVLAACCVPHHQGHPAPTPETLMRSRYSAFALDNRDYILRTWHNSTRPGRLPLEPDTQWKALAIIAAPPPSDTHGTVHFQAYFRERSGWYLLEEVSRFIFEAQRWWYLDGQPKVVRLKPRRNERCLCGSGRKLKVCCGE